MHPTFSRLAALALMAFALVGCASKDITGELKANQRPSVELTNAPIKLEEDEPYFYAYKLNWSGYDPDGRVAHYKISVRRQADGRLLGEDPTPTDTVWYQTEKNEETVYFRATQPDPIVGNNPPTASDPHVFVIKAVDDHGAESEIRTRAFFSFTVAPSVLIRNPVPSNFLFAQITPSVRVEWEGSDTDGQISQKPIKYKYRLLDLNDPVVVGYTADPYAFRDQEAADGWAEWDSTSSDTNFVQFTNLTPGKSYLFVVIGFDEAGAYSPVFSLNENMLRMTAGFASSNGPWIRFFNQFIDFTYPSGGYTTDPLREVLLEVPTGVPITICWDAIPRAGSRIEYFRWMVNGNINDNTRRTDEQNDYQYWSRGDPTKPNCVTLRPFPDGEHRFYLECGDNNTQKSLGILKLTAVTPTFDKPLIVVNDTRLEVDKFGGDPVQKQIPDIYTKPWPARTELDTFLFARGGFPWRGTKNPTSGVLSTPGVFAGYPLELSKRNMQPDTLGTRLGLENPARGVLLSRIGQYQHLIWMVDGEGGRYIDSIEQSIWPVTALWAMSGPGRASTLSAYTQLGGRVWLLGGGAAYASLQRFDDEINNEGQTTVLSSAAEFGELGPARILYDGAHWQSTIAISKGLVRTYRYEYTVNVRENGQVVPRTYIVKPPWSHQAGQDYLTSPDYSKLPVEMRPRSAIPDPLPPTRLPGQANLFYTSSYPIEYIHTPNFIVEDIDPDPEVVREASVLDSLYEGESIVLLTNPRPGMSLPRAPQMTYYHGNQARQFVFTGFAPWLYARQDCIALVDFVMQDIWGFTREPIDRGSFGPAALRNGARPVRTAAPVRRVASAARR